MSTTIQWTDETWNPVRGCKIVSDGCRHCYAMRQAHRFSADGAPYAGLTRMTSTGPKWTGEARFVASKLDQPLRWRKPRRVFVNSMSDLFHEQVSDEQIAAVFGVMAAAPRHTFQVLTKRPERAARWFEWVRTHAGPGIPWGGAEFAAEHSIATAWPGLPEHRRPVWNARSWAEPLIGERLDITEAHRSGWPLPNVWLGASVEGQATADERIPHLLSCPAAVRWISAEPLLGPVDLRDIDILPQQRAAAEAAGEWFPPCHLDALAGHVKGPDDLRPDMRLDWVVVGGESGPGARPCDVDWIRRVVRDCREAAVPVFVKQLGADAREGCAAAPRRCGLPECEDSGRCVGRLDLRHRKGGDPSEWPEDLRVREFPEVTPC